MSKIPNGDQFQNESRRNKCVERTFGYTGRGIRSQGDYKYPLLTGRARREPILFFMIAELHE
jgi:hypothetical protein